MRAASPTPSVTAAEEWRRFDACHICLAERGRPCLNLKSDADGAERHRPHPERLVVVDRDRAGTMILARAAAVTVALPRRPYRVAGALHAVIGGLTVCAGEPVADASAHPLASVEPVDRCRRPSCRRLMRAEEDR